MNWCFHEVRDVMTLGFTPTDVWSAENSTLIHQVPLHDAEVCVCCAMSATIILGYIFYETINSFRYAVAHTPLFFLNHLSD